MALDPKTLDVKDWFTQPGVEFAAAPIVFQEGGRDIVAVTTKDGRVLLLDAASLGGADHATPLFASAPLTGGRATFTSQSPAMWQERLRRNAWSGASNRRHALVADSCERAARCRSGSDVRTVRSRQGPFSP